MNAPHTKDSNNTIQQSLTMQEISLFFFFFNSDLPLISTLESGMILLLVELILCVNWQARV